MDDIVGPSIPEMKMYFTEKQLRQIWVRIQLIEQHFAKCCAFQMDRCHYADEYNEMYGRLHMAGLERWKTPFDNNEFEEWMEERK